VGQISIGANSLGLEGEIIDENGFVILSALSVSLEAVWVSAYELQHIKDVLIFRAMALVNDLHRGSMDCIKPSHEGVMVYGCSEVLFEAVIGGSELNCLTKSPSPERIRWTVFEASRRLAGIAPENYLENQALRYRYRHDAVFAAQRSADQILHLARNEQRESQTPQEWLAWAEAAEITVYPPCRRLIEYWSVVIHSKQLSGGAFTEQEFTSVLNDGNAIPPQFNTVRSAANKVLIAAAWQVEQRQRGVASLAQAIDLASEWHEEKDEPAYIGAALRFITEIDRKALSIKWKTQTGKQSLSDFEVLGKALARWHEKRMTR
jgi:hypothetical protein